MSLFILVFIHVLCLFCACVAFTALPDDWTPLSYGTCAYVGEVEVVGSVTQGNTCNFNNGATYMPQLWHDKHLLAVSQDVYNGFHTVDDFHTDCDISLQNADSTERNCGNICGVCFLINGPNGDAIYMANEIADIGAVDQNGQGINLHIDDDTIGEVRSTLALGYDITFKRVPCPGTETNGIWISYIQYNAEQDWKNAIEFTPINYRIGVSGIWVRGGTGSTDTAWYRLPRMWTNKYVWGSYGQYTEDCCPSWQPLTGSIYVGGTDFDMRIISQLGEDIICYGLTIELGVSNGLVQCVNEAGQPQQFTDNGYSFDGIPCDLSGTRPLDTTTSEPTTSGSELRTATPTAAPATTVPETSESTATMDSSSTTDPAANPSGNSSSCTFVFSYLSMFIVCFCVYLSL